jgi:hypothetical protein
MTQQMDYDRFEFEPVCGFDLTLLELGGGDAECGTYVILYLQSIYYYPQSPSQTSPSGRGRCSVLNICC